MLLGPTEEAIASPEAVLGGEDLQAVHRNAQRLLRLVNTLLDFSRIEAGRVEAVFEPTDLATFTAELASAFRSATERAGLQLIVQCDAHEPPGRMASSPESANEDLPEMSRGATWDSL